jgi:hypothetical protein
VQQWRTSIPRTHSRAGRSAADNLRAPTQLSSDSLTRNLCVAPRENVANPAIRNMDRARTIRAQRAAMTDRRRPLDQREARRNKAKGSSVWPLMIESECKYVGGPSEMLKVRGRRSASTQRREDERNHVGPPFSSFWFAHNIPRLLALRAKGNRAKMLSPFFSLLKLKILVRHRSHLLAPPQSPRPRSRRTSRRQRAQIVHGGRRCASSSRSAACAPASSRFTCLISAIRMCATSPTLRIQALSRVQLSRVQLCSACADQDSIEFRKDTFRTLSP